MKKFIKKHFAKILITLSLCLTITLSIFCITKAYAQDENNNGYNILPNGIQSLNLWDPNTTEYGTINASNGISGGGTSTLHCNYTEIKPNTHYIHNIIGGWSSGGGLAFYDINKNYISGFSSNSQYFNSFTTPTNAKFIRITAYIDNSSPQFVTNISRIMLNEGLTLLNFFPYGFYDGYNDYNWNEDVIKQNENLMKNSTSALYNAFNGAYAELIGRSSEILASGYCRLDPNDRNFEIGNLPSSFSDYYHNYDSENEDYYERPDIKIYLNYTVTNSLLFSFNDTALSRTVTLQNTNNTNNLTASNGGDSDMLDPYTLIINKENIGYNIIYYSGIYIPDYWQLDFNISFDAYTYSQGYTKGVESLQTTLNIERNNANYYKRLYEDNNQIISTLQQRIDDLQEQVNNNFGFKNIFFAMADTPFKTVSNFLGFELFGVDLFQAFIGFITVLACIWLIKKLI